MLLVDLTHI